ncbi:MAG TPA: haloalkane dehalogenase [Acidimicrobiales bacterium]|nr:haloalkane dehalogenase [Acidimicrobiales bacterium]
MSAAPGSAVPLPVIRTPEENFAALPDWPYEPHYFEVDGLRLHYLDEGPPDGPPFLLTHGEPTWSYLYRHWIRALVAAGFRVIAPDHIGFGRSDKVTDDDWYTIDRHVGVQRALIETLDLTRIHLFCQDWGGPISLRNACDQPERYARLFIANTWLHHDGYHYSDGLRFWHQIATDPEQMGGDMPTGMIVSRTLRRPGHDLAAIQAAYDAPFTGPESKAGARRFPWCLPFARPDEGGAAWQRRCHHQLQSWDGPIHLIWGDADEVFTWAGAEEWSSLLPGSTLDRIPGAGHFLQEDAPADCVAALLARSTGSGR